MCNECNGNYNNCPVCSQDETESVPCIECKGIGKIGYDDDGEETEYNGPFNTGGWDFCTRCEGEGTIQILIEAE